MTARPERRRSTLSGQSPIAPAAPVEPATALPTAVVQEPAPVVEAPAPAPVVEAPADAPVSHAAQPAAAVATKRSKYPPKVSFYQEKHDTDRVRGAILHTYSQEGVRSLSTFVNDAVMKEVERLEREYNDGQPFPPVGARELPQGRPLGE